MKRLEGSCDAVSDGWRPKLTRIEDPIADDYWQYTYPPGKKHVSRLTVGRPVHYPEARCWYTPVMVEGYLPQVTPVFGEGSVDSLINAMMLLKKFNDEIGEAVSYGKRHTVAQRKSSLMRGMIDTLVERKRWLFAGDPRAVGRWELRAKEDGESSLWADARGPLQYPLVFALQRTPEATDWPCWYDTPLKVRFLVMFRAKEPQSEA